MRATSLIAILSVVGLPDAPVAPVISVSTIRFANASAAGNPLLGRWYALETGRPPSGATGPKGVLWDIRANGAFAIWEANALHGQLSARQGTWAVRSPTRPGDLEHGTYRAFVESDLFKTRIAGLPAEDITWTLVLAGTRPARLPRCLMKLIDPGEAARGSNEGFDAALLGLWEASYRLNGKRHETLWRILPDDQSLRLDVTVKPMRYRGGAGRFTVITPGGEETVMALRIVDRDAIEIAEGNESLRLSRCRE